MMINQKQKTLKNEVSFYGIGVHSGQEVGVILRPGVANSGVLFWSRLFPRERFVIGQVLPEVAMHATVIKQSHWVLSTVEHLMAVLCMLGVDNVEIEVIGTEVPILDGSALPFVQGILSCGLREVEARRWYLTPRQLIRLDDDKGRFVELIPATYLEGGMIDYGLYVDYTAEFNNSLIGAGSCKKQITQDVFVHEIAPARTFGFLEQLPLLRKHGLAKGTSLGNTVVINQDDFLNELRFENECIHHKVLDLLGDVALLGKAFAGGIRAHKTGHSFNRLIIEHYLQNRSLWTEV